MKVTQQADGQAGAEGHPSSRLASYLLDLGSSDGELIILTAALWSDEGFQSSSGI